MSKHIYKYTDLNSALNMIVDNSVKLEFPKNYNDPFDAQIEFDERDVKKAEGIIKDFLITQSLLNIPKTEIEKFSPYNKFALTVAIASICITRINTKNTMRYSPDFFSVKLSKYIFERIKEKTDFENKYTELLAKLKEERNHVVVSCFSKNNNSLLMWSHYANCHKGVCIEYDRPEDFVNVKYRKKSSKFNLVFTTKRAIANFMFGNRDSETEPDLKILLKPFFVKSTNWKYEDEVRCMFNVKETDSIKEKEIFVKGEKKKILVYIMPTKINKIYLGCKIDKDSNEFHQLCGYAKEKGIELIQMNVDTKHYKVY